MIKNFLTKNCQDDVPDAEATSGFDSQAGETWIYPTNYPLRDYQFNIIKEALFKNVLVSLPTGLGKTFIAAVVMYNFYRWYPTGKIVFMAPTRPLVKQQIDACYNIMAIPKEVTVELTGSKLQTTRNQIWNDKRVFFVTPQVLQNDLDTIENLACNIKCIVFDEAHRARGNHAYCEVVRKLHPKNRFFRVLALSATPGSSLTDVTEVIQNLLISQIEIKTEESADVIPYVHQRSMETIVVPLDGKLQQVRDKYIQVLEIYTRVLIKYKIITGNCSSLTKGRIFMIMKNFQEKGRQHGSYSEIMKNLNICITLYHAYELLIRHGLRSFLVFCDEHASKPLLRGNIKLHDLMEEVRAYLGPLPVIETMPDGSIPEIPAPTIFGHPKFYKLKDILVDHFKKAEGTSSRVMVFFEYRESVMEAYTLLLIQKPLIKARIFLGQGAMPQRQQLNVVASFKSGECNTLLSTCIGEEGLDIGDVNLIVCFDISNKSPIRMVQRMGRTGRKGKGQVIILVTEGKEQQTLNDCLQQKSSMSKNMVTTMNFNKHIFIPSPRMIPEDITPGCVKMYMTVEKENNNSKPTKAKKSNNVNTTLRTMFNRINAAPAEPSFSQELNNIKQIEPTYHIPTPKYYWNEEYGNVPYSESNMNVYNKNVDRLRNLHPSEIIGSSLCTEILVSLLSLADSKRYNLPVTQGQLPSELGLPNKKAKIVKTDTYKQSDIRMMFAKTKSTDSITPSQDFVPSQTVTSPVKEDNQFDKTLLNELQHEISSYITIKCAEDIECTFCKNFFPCLKYSSTKPKSEPKPLNYIPRVNYNSISKKDLESFMNSLDLTNKNERISRVKKYETKEVEKRLTPLDYPLFELNERIEAKECKIENPVIYQEDETISKFKKEKVSPKIAKMELDNFGLEDSPLFSSQKLKMNKNEDISTNNKEILMFFKLTNLSELFISEKSNSLSPIVKKIESTQDSDVTISYSPASVVELSSEDNSPILSTFEKSQRLKNKAKKNLFNLSLNKSKEHDTSETIEDFKKTIEKPFIKNDLKLSTRLSTNNKTTNKSFDISDNDFFDSSLLNFSSQGATKINERNKEMDKMKSNVSTLNCSQKLSLKKNEAEVLVGLDDDFFDDSLFDHLGLTNYTQKLKEKSTINQETSSRSKKENLIHNSQLKVSKSNAIEPSKNKEKLSGISLELHSSNTKIAISKTRESQSAVVETKKTTKSSKICTKTVNASFEESNIFEDDMDDFLFDDFSTVSKHNKVKEKIKALSKNIEDVCDLSILGFDTNEKPKQKEESNKNLSQNIGVEDICDLSIFGLETSSRKTVSNCNNKLNRLRLNPNSSSQRPSTRNSVCDISVSHEESQVTVTQAVDLLLNSSPEKSPSLLSKKAKTSIRNRTPDRVIGNTSNELSPKLSRPSSMPRKSLLQSYNKKTNEDEMLFKKPISVINPPNKFDTSIVIEDSDDDFEQSANISIRNSPAKVSPCKNSRQRIKNDNLNVNIAKRKRKRNNGQVFLDLEAELSEEDCEIVSEDENEDNLDAFEESFVDDCTQNDANTTDIHAKYLQSVRSPHIVRGKFKIPLRPLPSINVYSQEVSNEESHYMNDTFCVDTETIEIEDDLSELELAELRLKEERKARKRTKKKQKDQSNPKRRRIKIISSDDSD